MPELPEIEHLKRTLEPTLLGSRVLDVQVFRRDVVNLSRSIPARHLAAALLKDATVSSLHRHGKNLAILGSTGNVLCVHLGMTGTMRVVDVAQSIVGLSHVHCVWELRSKHGRRARMYFRDPRRFGGLWPYTSMAQLLEKRWGMLGPDALSISHEVLFAALQRTNRSIKAALLDQAVLAGVGNIYADEALFSAMIHPLSCASSIPSDRVRELVIRIQQIMRRAIDSGGSTIRDYADGNGELGAFARTLVAYGRGGEPCTVCGKPLIQRLIAQRTSVYCSDCQRLFRKTRAKANAA